MPLFLRTVFSQGIRINRVKVKGISPKKISSCSRILHTAGGYNNKPATVKENTKSTTPVLESLKERGLYHEDLYRHYAHHKIDKIWISPDKKSVNLAWNDGQVSNFHSIWLRHFCQCPDCKLDHNGMSKVDLGSIDPDIKLASAQIEGDEIVQFQWVSSDGSEPHGGHISKAYLKIHCYSDTSLDRQSEERSMKYSEDKTTPQVDYNTVASSEEGLYQWLTALSDRGICLLKNVPQENGFVAKVAEMVASIQHTVYGEVFDVVTQPRPINAAYSDAKLSLHMDQIHYESPPGIQLLHCLKFDSRVKGGDNYFADIHEIAHKFRQEQPDYFDILVRVPFTAQTMNYRKDFSIHMQIQRPIFTLNHRKELVSVHWHPMLIGALQAPHADVEQFYKAYIAFNKMVNAYSSMYKILLSPGDLISFNNRRVLHGRAVMVGEAGERHLQGTYMEIGEFQSRVQVLHSKYSNGRRATRSGSNDWC